MSSHFSEKVRTHKIISLLLSLLAVIVVITPLFYFRSVRKLEDPRIVKVKFYEKQYDKLTKNKDLKNAFKYLDSIESVFIKYDDYKNSFEMGQILNRKAVNWLQLAIAEKNDSFRIYDLDSAKIFAENSITIYELWISEFRHLSRNEIIIKIQSNYLPNEPLFKGKNLVTIINKRTDEILKAQKETPLHLSLAYTNLGSIYQYFGDYKMAIKNNRKAIEIWSSNETAKTNIEFLIDRTLNKKDSNY